MSQRTTLGSRGFSGWSRTKAARTMLVVRVSVFMVRQSVTFSDQEAPVAVRRAWPATRSRRSATRWSVTPFCSARLARAMARKACP